MMDGAPHVAPGWPPNTYKIKNREGRVTRYYAEDASCKYWYQSDVYSGQESIKSYLKV